MQKINGRVKHIYSIWRKMQRKMVGYNEIYDVCIADHRANRD